MNEEFHRRLREEELAFFGSIAADISHEMRNVLSVIGEYAGLLDDLLALADRGTPLDGVKLKKLSTGMSRQVGKGTKAMERFSRFAHATDERTGVFDLVVLMGDMVALAQRQATLSGCTLEAEFPDEAIPVRANPFSLQHAASSAIKLILELLESGESARIRLVTQGVTAVISVFGTTTAGGGELSGRISQLSAVMNELKGSVETSRANGMLTLMLTIPIN